MSIIMVQGVTEWQIMVRKIQSIVSTWTANGFSLTFMLSMSSEIMPERTRYILWLAIVWRSWNFNECYTIIQWCMTLLKCSIYPIQSQSHDISIHVYMDIHISCSTEVASNLLFCQVTCWNAHL